MLADIKFAVAEADRLFRGNLPPAQGSLHGRQESGVYKLTVDKEQWIPLAMLSVAPLATLAVVLAGFLYNNARLRDLRNDLTSR